MADNGTDRIQDRVAMLERRQDVMETKLDDIKSLVLALRETDAAHYMEGVREIQEVKREIGVMEIDLTTQRMELASLKSGMLELKTSMDKVATIVTSLDRKLVKISSYMGFGVALFMIIKEPILKAIGLG